MLNTPAAPAIRVVAICLFSDAGRILAARSVDPVKQQTFYRPFGGGVEWGEDTAAAMRREIAEELGEPIHDLVLLDVIENLYTFNGKAGHEIVFVYDARFDNAALYAQDEVTGIECDGQPLRGHWIPLAAMQSGQVLVYPPGMARLLAPHA